MVNISFNRSSNSNNPFVAVIFGIIMFFGSFALLFWNESRTDLSKIADKAEIINAYSIDPSANGKLVAITGTMNSNEYIGDTYLKAGNYIAVKRITQMYSWEKRSNSSSSSSSNNRRSYTYTKTWMQSPDSISDGYYRNPHKSIENKENKATNSKIGAYNIDMSAVTLSNYTPINLSYANIIPDYGMQLAGDWLYTRSSSINTPEIGDIRIKYNVVLPSTLSTAIGLLYGNQLTSYIDKKNNSLCRVLSGTKDDAVKTLHDEYNTSVWLFRVFGFFLMTFGLICLAEPLTLVLRVIPYLGEVTSGLIGIAAVIISLVLSIITIVIGRIINEPLYLVLAIFLIGIVIWYYMPEKAEIERRNSGWS